MSRYCLDYCQRSDRCDYMFQKIYDPARRINFQYDSILRVEVRVDQEIIYIDSLDRDRQSLFTIIIHPKKYEVFYGGDEEEEEEEEECKNILGKDKFNRIDISLRNFDYEFQIFESKNIDDLDKIYEKLLQISGIFTNNCSRFCDSIEEYQYIIKLYEIDNDSPTFYVVPSHDMFDVDYSDRFEGLKLKIYRDHVYINSKVDKDPMIVIDRDTFETEIKADLGDISTSERSNMEGRLEDKISESFDIKSLSSIHKLLLGIKDFMDNPRRLLTGNSTKRANS